MSIAIIHHVPGNTLGHLEGVLHDQNVPFHYLFCQSLNQHHLSLKGIRGLILLGGRESVTGEAHHSFMRLEQQLIRNAIARDLPVFGICLGGQMLARSLGGTVGRNQVNGKHVKEIGWMPIQLTGAGKADPVLRHLAEACQFQWHEDTFHLPPECTMLAQSELCPRQAFRLEKSGAPVYGVQFHPEITPTIIEQWLEESTSLTEARKQSLREETRTQFNRWTNASKKMFEAFCERAF